MPEKISSKQLIDELMLAVGKPIDESFTLRGDVTAEKNKIKSGDRCLNLIGSNLVVYSTDTEEQKAQRQTILSLLERLARNAAFRNEEADRFRGEVLSALQTERAMLSDLGSDLFKRLDDINRSALLNARANLYAVVGEVWRGRYDPNNAERIRAWSREIKKYAPEDAIAEFCELLFAARKNPRKVEEFLTERRVGRSAAEREFVLRTTALFLEEEYLLPLNVWLEDYQSEGGALHDHFRQRLDAEKGKLDQGVYDPALSREVFVAYSRDDIDEVMRLVSALEANKRLDVRCFVATRNLRQCDGAEYERSLRTAIENCRVFLFVSSENSRKRNSGAYREMRWVKEDDRAAYGDKSPLARNCAYDDIPSVYKKLRIEYLIGARYDGTAPYDREAKDFFLGMNPCTTFDALKSCLYELLEGEPDENPIASAPRVEEPIEPNAEEEKTPASRVDTSVGETDKEQKPSSPAQPKASPSKEEIDAWYRLGRDCYKGENGAKKDPQKALSYIRRAATAGHADAQFVLGYCYEYGKLLAPSSQEALLWYKKAAAQGNRKAIESVKRLEKSIASHPAEPALEPALDPTVTKAEAIRLFREKGYTLKSKSTTFATKNETVGVYWATVDPKHLRKSWYLILNDKKDRSLHLYHVPANSLSEGELVYRTDKRVLNLEFLLEGESAVDRVSGYDFRRFFKERMTYPPVNANAGGKQSATAASADPVEEGKVSLISIHKDGFGSYPQSLVTNKKLLTRLNASASPLPTAQDGGKWTSYRYYLNERKDVDFMWYIDLEVGGERYRGVYFSAFRSLFSIGRVGNGGDPAQWRNNYYLKKVYWFKYEPIKWRIVSSKKGGVLLFSDRVLDAQEFSHGQPASKDPISLNDYAKSDIRAWLNGTFLQTAFSEKERAMIREDEADNGASSCVPANAGPHVSTFTCKNTKDKVFLLSLEEVTTVELGFESNANADSASRRRRTTDYAEIQGVRSQFSGGEERTGAWWLRSPVEDSPRNVRQVDAVGNADRSCIAYYTAGGVVPAIRVRTARNN